MEDLYQVGTIVNTHGVKGEVKVFPLTDDISRFKGMKNLLMATKDGYKSLDVESARSQKNLVLLKFKGIDSLNDVEAFKGNELFVTKDNRVKLKKDEYFVADLIGLEVFDESDTKIGDLVDVMETGANDVYVINMLDGAELLLPAIKDCILNVDVDANKIKVHVLDGLL